MTSDGSAIGQGTATSQDAAGEAGANTITVTDNRTGTTYELPISDGTVRAMRPQADQNGRRRFRADVLRPGVHEHRVVSQRDHLHRRRRRDPPAPRLPDRAALRALHVPRGRLPADQRRAPDAGAAGGLGRTRSRSTRSCTRTSRTSCRASATTRTRWACSSRPSARSRRSTRTPTRSTTRTSARSRSSACSRRCRRSPPSPSATTWASPTCTPTTSSTTRATSSG